MIVFLFLSLLSVKYLYDRLLSDPLPVPRIRHYKWEVKYEYKSPDCYKILAITINGQTPGPTIEAQLNDTIIVELKNRLLAEMVAVHWHGIHQLGTFLYHAHYGLQSEHGLYGMIKVSLPPGDSEPYTYDYGESIILVDWYHKSTYEHWTLLNTLSLGRRASGKGRFNCSTPGSEANLCNATNPECSPHAMTVVPRKTYRLRIGSLTSLSALSFEIEDHNMTIVGTGGHNVEPFIVKNLFIYSS
ncbi:hypothetical protein Vadar_014483 [Vaccinium darrowii]|uniref:Uncharacterized protein n=1 Tax=Vaccinium darrowii TaxID=229202 RepID=A0ACB7Z4G2_9ERIC|nr:hypothetical protein Vadar_014483 [Vaccinium darrowii]